LHVRKSLLLFLQARHVPAVESSSLRGAHGVLMRGEGVCVQGGGREGVIAMHNGFETARGKPSSQLPVTLGPNEHVTVPPPHPHQIRTG
jgi:hypothetical protein